ncbi:prepilin peptidase, partial [Acetobacter orientalis]
MPFIVIGLLGGLFFLAVCNDIATREISDCIWVVFFVVAIFFGYILSWHSVLGAIFIYLFFFLLWKLDLLGGGDVKLIAASSIFFTIQD